MRLEGVISSDFETPGFKPTKARAVVIFLAVSGMNLSARDTRICMGRIPTSENSDKLLQ